jgi:uncharacterized membrane protein YvlD (DUF360 family)
MNLRAIGIRLAGIVIVLAVCGWLLPGSLQEGGLLWGSVMLGLLYIFLRPLLLTIVLPLNLLLFGLVTPLADALLVCWTAAWVGGLSLTYWQAVLVALALSLAYLPYSNSKQRRLGCKLSTASGTYNLR